MRFCACYPPLPCELMCEMVSCRHTTLTTTITTTSTKQVAYMIFMNGLIKLHVTCAVKGFKGYTLRDVRGCEGTGISSPKIYDALIACLNSYNMEPNNKLDIIIAPESH